MLVTESVYRSFLLYCIYYFMCKTVFRISEEKFELDNKAVLLILLVTILNYVSFKISNGLLKGLITYLGFSLFAVLAKKSVGKESFLIGFTMYIHAAVMEIITTLIVSIFGFASFLEGSNNLDVDKLVYTLFLSTIIYGSTLIPFIKKIIINIKKFLINRKHVTYILVFILLSFEISIMLFIMNTGTYIESVMSIILVVLISFGVFSLINSIKKKEELELVNQNLIMKSESFLKILNDYKTFKHNIKHELIAISSIGDHKVKEMVSTYIKEYDESYDLDISDIVKIPNGLRGIIYQKILETKNTNCNIIVDNFAEDNAFNNLNISELCRLTQCFGIVFDNAVECASKSDNGFVYLKFFEINGLLNIECSNPINELIYIDEIGVNGYSSKQNHMGVGTSYLKSQRVVDVSSQIRNNMYVVILKLKK